MSAPPALSTTSPRPSVEPGRALAARPDAWRPLVRYDAGERRFEQLLRDEHLDVWVISLDGGPRHRLPRPRPLERRRRGRRRAPCARTGCSLGGAPASASSRPGASFDFDAVGHPPHAPPRRRPGRHHPRLLAAAVAHGRLRGRPDGDAAPRTRSPTPRSCARWTASPRSALADVLERGCARALVPDRRRRHPRRARLRPASAARAPARASRCRGCPRSTAGSSRAATLALQVDARSRRPSPSTTRASRPGRWSARACSRSTAPSTRRHRGPVRAAVPARRGARRGSPRRLEETDRLIDALEPAGRAELRRGLAGPLAVRSSPARSGSRIADAGAVLGWYDAIVAAVTEMTAGKPVRGRVARRSPRCARHRARVRGGRDRRCWRRLPPTPRDLSDDEIVSNAAVLLFGGIETTEGMIANALVHLLDEPGRARALESARRCLLERDRGVAAARAGRGRVTATRPRDVELDGAPIRRGDLVRLSIAAANRDPAVFTGPRPLRPAARERAAPPGVRARPARLPRHAPRPPRGAHRGRPRARPPARPAPRPRPPPAAPRGLVFRKPPALHVVWS